MARGDHVGDQPAAGEGSTSGAGCAEEGVPCEDVGADGGRGEVGEGGFLDGTKWADLVAAV